jgi:carbonic anhydrase
MSQSDRSRNPCRWSYHGDTGPEHWGTLNRDDGTLCFPFCVDTRTSQQSPIDIETSAVTPDPTLPTLVFRSSTSTVNVTDGHNNFTAHYPPGSNNTLLYKGATYRLIQFHFHHPAGHQANGVAIGTIELHLVYLAGAPPQTQALVVAVFMTTPSANIDDGKILEQLVDNINKTIDVDAGNLFPAACPYFAYQGSFTTPPRAEGVTWLLIDKAMPVHPDNVHKFKSGLEAKYGYGYNARCVQRLNGRTVYSSREVATAGGFAASLRRR